MGATAKIVLFKGKKYKDETHPVYLQLTIDRKNKYYNFGNNLKCKIEQWDKKKVKFKKSFSNYENANNNLEKAIFEANEVLLDLKKKKPNFTHEDFKRKYSKNNEKIYLFEYMDTIIKRLKQAGRVGNASTYQTARNVLYTYFGKELELSDISSKKLAMFIENCQSRGLKPNTISNYLRTLRAIYNRAIKEENFDYYPFKNFNWKPLKNKSHKRAISKKDINRIMNIELKEETDLFNAQQFFSFMYLCYGLNFADLAKIEANSIVKANDIYLLTYERSKGGKLYEIPLSNEALEILKYYNDKRTSKYIFPVLNEAIHITPEQIKNRIKTALKKFNSDLKHIGTELEIEEKITSYVTRHTFASVLAKAGTNVFTIGEMLGHSDLRTTQIYLKDLDYSEKITASKNLID